MKRTLLALFLCPALAGPAYAVEAPEPPAPPAAPHAPLPPLPPLPPMDRVQGSGPVATLAVKGPVTMRVDTVSSDIEIVPGSAKQVKAQLIDGGGGITLHQQGDRVELNFSGRGGWPHIPGGIDGHVRVELPPGSHVELTSASGDIVVRDVGGNVRLRTASGEVRLVKPGNVEAQAVSGDVVIENASGEVRLRTVSGDAHVSQSAGGGSKVEFGSTSGDLSWAGGCNSGCRIEARTMSGNITLVPSNADFELRYVTHNGDLDDDLRMQTLENTPSRHGSGSVHARVGKGQGLIEVQTFSGDLHVSRR